MSKFDDIDDSKYQETNCGLGMAGYMTPDEKEIERLNKRVEELELRLEQEQVRLAACTAAALGYANGLLEPHEYGYSASYRDVVELYGKYQAHRKRVEELERELETVNENWKRDMEARKNYAAKLQRYRELAEMARRAKKNGAADVSAMWDFIVAMESKAREILEDK